MAGTQHTTGTPSRTRVMRWALAGTAAAVLAADQISKCLVMAHATAGNYSTAPLSIGLAANHGATMGVGAGSPLLVTLAALAVALLAAAFALRATSRTAALLLAAVFGGALGNLADRLLRAPGIGTGGVVDWIHLNIAGHGVSLNIADIALQVCVPAALIATLITARRLTANRTATTPATVTTVTTAAAAATAAPATAAVTATTAAYALAA
jgi:signal peptidase II